MNDKQKAYAAFVAAQKEFAPALKKSLNPHFGKQYADLAACVEAVVDALNNHGLAVMQRPIPNERGVTIETIFLHESGEEINGGQFHSPASKQDPQGYGSACTYCRRYGLMAACGIAPEDDDGNAAVKGAEKAAQVNQTDLVMEWIADMDTCTTVEQLKEHFAVAWKATKQNKAIKQHYDKLKEKFTSMGEQA
jgi:hypothetical protein